MDAAFGSYLTSYTYGGVSTFAGYDSVILLDGKKEEVPHTFLKYSKKVASISVDTAKNIIRIIIMTTIHQNIVGSIFYLIENFYTLFYNHEYHIK